MLSASSSSSSSTATINKQIHNQNTNNNPLTTSILSQSFPLAALKRIARQYGLPIKPNLKLSDQAEIISESGKFFEKDLKELQERFGGKSLRVGGGKNGKVNEGPKKVVVQLDSESDPKTKRRKTESKAKKSNIKQDKTGANFNTTQFQSQNQCEESEQELHHLFSQPSPLPKVLKGSPPRSGMSRSRLLNTEFREKFKSKESLNNVNLGFSQEYIESVKQLKRYALRGKANKNLNLNDDNRRKRNIQSYTYQDNSKLFDDHSESGSGADQNDGMSEDSDNNYPQSESETSNSQSESNPKFKTKRPTADLRRKSKTSVLNSKKQLQTAHQWLLSEYLDAYSNKTQIGNFNLEKVLQDNDYDSDVKLKRSKDLIQLYKCSGCGGQMKRYLSSQCFSSPVYRWTCERSLQLQQGKNSTTAVTESTNALLSRAQGCWNHSCTEVLKFFKPLLKPRIILEMESQSSFRVWCEGGAWLVKQNQDNDNFQFLQPLEGERVILQELLQCACGILQDCLVREKIVNSNYTAHDESENNVNKTWQHMVLSQPRDDWITTSNNLNEALDVNSFKPSLVFNLNDYHTVYNACRDELEDRLRSWFFDRYRCSIEIEGIDLEFLRMMRELSSSNSIEAMSKSQTEAGQVPQRQELSSFSSSCINRLSQNQAYPNLWKNLRPYQQKSVEFALKTGQSNTVRFLDASEMGLGKTRSSIAIVVAAQLFPCLILTKAVCRLGWKIEFEKCGFSRLSLSQSQDDHDVQLNNSTDIHLIQSADDALSDGNKPPKVTILSYHMAVNLLPQLLRAKWKSVIVDESHFLKGSGSSGGLEHRTNQNLNNKQPSTFMSSESENDESDNIHNLRPGSNLNNTYNTGIMVTDICRLLKSIPNLLFLTGTPCVRHAQDMSLQMELLLGGRKGKIWKIFQEYVRMQNETWDWDLNGFDNAEQANSYQQFKLYQQAQQHRQTRNTSLKLNNSTFCSANRRAFEFNLFLKSTVMSRFLKKDVLKDLPCFRDHIRYVSIGIKAVNKIGREIEEQKKIKKRGKLERFVEGVEETTNQIQNLPNPLIPRVLCQSESDGEMKQDLQDMNDTSDNQVEKNSEFQSTKPSQLSTTTLQLTSLTKLSIAKSWLIELITQHCIQKQEKLVIFAHHKKVLDEVERISLSLSIDFIRIDGDHDQTKRQKSLNEFQFQIQQQNHNTVQKMIALISITAAGVGVNGLQAASAGVFLELPDTANWLQQCKGRLHRPKSQSQNLQGQNQNENQIQNQNQNNSGIDFYYLLAHSNDDGRFSDLKRWMALSQAASRLEGILDRKTTTTGQDGQGSGVNGGNDNIGNSESQFTCVDKKFQNQSQSGMSQNVKNSPQKALKRNSKSGSQAALNQNTLKITDTKTIEDLTHLYAFEVSDTLTTHVHRSVYHPNGPGHTGTVYLPSDLVHQEVQQDHDPLLLLASQFFYSITSTIPAYARVRLRGKPVILTELESVAKSISRSEVSGSLVRLAEPGRPSTVELKLFEDYNRKNSSSTSSNKLKSNFKTSDDSQNHINNDHDLFWCVSEFLDPKFKTYTAYAQPYDCRKNALLCCTCFKELDMSVRQQVEWRDWEEVDEKEEDMDVDINGQITDKIEDINESSGIESGNEQNLKDSETKFTKTNSMTKKPLKPSLSILSNKSNVDYPRHSPSPSPPSGKKNLPRTSRASLLKRALTRTMSMSQNMSMTNMSSQMSENQATQQSQQQVLSQIDEDQELKLNVNDKTQTVNVTAIPNNVLKEEAKSTLLSIEQTELNRHINVALREFCRLEQGKPKAYTGGRLSTTSNGLNTSFDEILNRSYINAVPGCFYLRHHTKHDLFCSGQCANTYKMRRSSSKLRSNLFSQERGVCQQCGVDCDSLFVQLQQLKTSNNTIKDITSLARNLLYKTFEKTIKLDSSKIDGTTTSQIQGQTQIQNHQLSDSTISKIIENIVNGLRLNSLDTLWQCDHIIEIRDGGGEAADLSELQTLCVFCHLRKTIGRTKGGQSSNSAINNGTDGTVDKKFKLKSGPARKKDQDSLKDKTNATVKNPKPKPKVKAAAKAKILKQTGLKLVPKPNSKTTTNFKKTSTSSSVSNTIKSQSWSPKVKPGPRKSVTIASARKSVAKPKTIRSNPMKKITMSVMKSVRKSGAKDGKKTVASNGKKSSVASNGKKRI